MAGTIMRLELTELRSGIVRPALGGRRGEQNNVREDQRLRATPGIRSGLSDCRPHLILGLERVLLDHRPNRGGNCPDVSGEVLRRVELKSDLALLHCNLREPT